MTKKTRGLFELYAADPERADAELWGRRTSSVDRRGFLKGTGVAALSAALGAYIPFWRNLPAGLFPVALADESSVIPGKDPGLVVLNERPLNAETPAHLLSDSITPPSRLFIRNNGHPPTKVDPASWTLTIDGESVEQSKTFSLADLKRNFKPYTYQLQLECGGNGRHEFYPPARGNQWSTGAVGCPQWTGVRLRDVLEASGIKKDAVYIGYYGADLHPSGDKKKAVISRGVPMRKALENETLIAWAVGGQDIPINNGHPLRLVCGGWPGSTSGKWLQRISIRNKIHDGTKMSGLSYRVPCFPVSPGEKLADGDMCIIESMPVKSLITSPKSGLVHARDKALEIGGHAWAGDLAVKSVAVSIDFGQTWQPARLKRAANRLAWQDFTASVRFPQKGYYEVWARATDQNGKSQPMIVPGWNSKGYLNNACHRIAVRVS